MPLESANFIDGLVITNPPGTDLKSQGDDHLQLIKKVLKNTFPGATRPFPIPTATATSASMGVTASQQNSLIVVSNTDTVTLTMPALLSTDAGWSIDVIRLPGSTGKLFIAPPSGTIISGQLSVAKARRCIPGVQFKVLWTGSNWIAQRCASNPLGSVLPLFTGTALGYEFANGQVLPSDDYPEYAIARAGPSPPATISTPDLRERMLAGSDMGLASPNLINPGRSGINPTVLESAGGFDVVSLIQSNLPNAALSFSGGGSGSGSGSISGTIADGRLNPTMRSLQAGPGGGPFNFAVRSDSGGGIDNTGAWGSIFDGGVSGSCSVSVSVSVSGSTSSINGATTQTNVNKMPPTSICHYAVIVE